MLLTSYSHLMPELRMSGGRNNTFVECSDAPSHLPEAHGFVYRKRFVSTTGANIKDIGLC